LQARGPLCHYRSIRGISTREGFSDELKTPNNTAEQQLNHSRAGIVVAEEVCCLPALQPEHHAEMENKKNCIPNGTNTNTNIENDFRFY